MCFLLPQSYFWCRLIVLLVCHNNLQSCGCLQVTKSAVQCCAKLCMPSSCPNLSPSVRLQSPMNCQYCLTLLVIPLFLKLRLYICFWIVSSVPSNTWLFLLKQQILLNQLLIRICSASPEVLSSVSL